MLDELRKNLTEQGVDSAAGKVDDRLYLKETVKGGTMRTREADFQLGQKQDRQPVPLAA